MYVTRFDPHLPLPLHATIDVTAGILMVLAPPILSFSLAAGLVSVVLGALLTGIGLNLVVRERGPVAAHRAFDTAFMVVTAIAALALALSAGAQMVAVVFLAAVAVLQAAVGLTTRYGAGG
jgi:hypothetical protein